MGGAGVISRILGITVVCVDRVFVVVIIVVSAVSLPACSCSHVQYERVFIVITSLALIAATFAAVTHFHFRSLTCSTNVLRFIYSSLPLYRKNGIYGELRIFSYLEAVSYLCVSAQCSRKLI